MLKKTIVRIMETRPIGLKTVIGEFAYIIRYNDKTKSLWIYQSRAEDARYTWIKEGFEFVSPWKPWREM